MMATLMSGALTATRPTAIILKLFILCLVLLSMVVIGIPATLIIAGAINVSSTCFIV